MNRKQYGFTQGRSTIDNGIEIVQKIFGAWEDSRDVVGLAIGLLESYLNNRVQRIDINGICGYVWICVVRHADHKICGPHGVPQRVPGAHKPFTTPLFSVHPLPPYIVTLILPSSHSLSLVYPIPTQVARNAGDSSRVASSDHLLNGS
ncbi:hypothetical protein EVAR_76837_1 [Eumeta japonica]|uniref:Uncharacterized protein n=1 Tax=Eumeta variegata TaxID=151549 RepID=A0A4C1YZ74_EUMVA|nr:hypothetical protein EVAR_76837_1 [Eumeta japonica]